MSSLFPMEACRKVWRLEIIIIIGSTETIETKTKHLPDAVEQMLPINQVKLPVEEQMFKPQINTLHDLLIRLVGPTLRLHIYAAVDPAFNSRVFPSKRLKSADRMSALRTGGVIACSCKESQRKI